MIRTAAGDAPTTRKESECFICRQKSPTVVFREDPYEARLCHSCGSVYTNPMPGEEEVDGTEESHPELFYSLSAPFKASWMARFCPSGRLLEVGCGKGFFLSEARKLGYEVVGIEPNSEDAGFARQHFGLSVESCLLEDHSLIPRSFDVVYHCDLLAHFRDPLAALAKMSDLLTPKGVLCFEVGLMAGISPLWYHVIGRVGLGPHLWFFSREGFERMIDRAGLRLVRVQDFGLAPRAVLSRVSGPLLKRVVSPLLEMFFPGQNGEIRTRVIGLQERFRNFLRYRVGAVLPGIGPRTLLVIAEADGTPS